MWPPYRTVVSIECNGYEARGADARGGAAVRGARVPRDVDGRARAGARRPEGLALLAHRLEAGASVPDDARGGECVPRGARRGARGSAGSRPRAARAARASSSRGRAARRRDRLHARMALPRGRAPRGDRRRAASVRGTLARALPRGRRVGRSSHRPRCRCGDAARPLSAANWAYTWLEPGRDTDDLADRFLAILVDGIRGYATPQ